MPYGGTVLHFPDNCPQCGAEFIKKRGATRILCLECGVYGRSHLRVLLA